MISLVRVIIRFRYQRSDSTYFPSMAAAKKQCTEPVTVLHFVDTRLDFYQLDWSKKVEKLCRQAAEEDVNAKEVIAMLSPDRKASVFTPTFPVVVVHEEESDVYVKVCDGTVRVVLIVDPTQEHAQYRVLALPYSDGLAELSGRERISARELLDLFGYEKFTPGQDDMWTYLTSFCLAECASSGARIMACISYDRICQPVVNDSEEETVSHAAEENAL